MADAQASDAARELARARWGNAVVQRAVAVVVERQAELDAPLLAELRAVIRPPAAGVEPMRRQPPAGQEAR